MAAAFNNLRQLVSGAHPLAPAVPLSDGGPRRPTNAQTGLQPVFYNVQRLVVHPALWPTRGAAVGSASTLRPARKSISEYLKEKKMDGEILTPPADGEGTLGDLVAIPSS